MTASPMAQAVLHDGWGELILSRPQRKNALVGPMVADLQAGLATLLVGAAKAVAASFSLSRSAAGFIKLE